MVGPKREDVALLLLVVAILEVELQYCRLWLFPASNSSAPIRGRPAVPSLPSLISAVFALPSILNWRLCV